MTVSGQLHHCVIKVPVTMDGERSDLQGFNLYWLAILHNKCFAKNDV